jgi:hypothetical protein
MASLFVVQKYSEYIGRIQDGMALNKDQKYSEKDCFCTNMYRLSILIIIP